VQERVGLALVLCKQKLSNSWSPLASSYSCVLYKLQPGCSDCYLLETTPKILLLSVTCPHHENKQTNKPTNHPVTQQAPRILPLKPILVLSSHSSAQLSLWLQDLLDSDRSLLVMISITHTANFEGKTKRKSISAGWCSSQETTRKS